MKDLARLTLSLVIPDPVHSPYRAVLDLLDAEFPGGGATAKPDEARSRPVVSQETPDKLLVGPGARLVIRHLEYDALPGRDSAGRLVRIATVSAEDACRLLGRLCTLGWTLSDASPGAMARWAAGEPLVPADFEGPSTLLPDPLSGFAGPGDTDDYTPIKVERER